MGINNFSSLTFEEISKSNEPWSQVFRERIFPYAIMRNDKKGRPYAHLFVSSNSHALTMLMRDLNLYTRHLGQSGWATGANKRIILAYAENDISIYAFDSKSSIAYDKLCTELNKTYCSCREVSNYSLI